MDNNELFELLNQKPHKWPLNKMKVAGYKIEQTANMNTEQIEHLIIDTKINSINAIQMFVSTIRFYNMNSENGNKDIDKILKQIDRNKLLEECKNNFGIKKYLSYSKFTDLINRIENDQERTMPNCHYNAVLLRAIYGGIYSPNLSALKNLKESSFDFDDDCVYVNLLVENPNGQNTYPTIKVEKKLAEDIISLSKMPLYKRNRHGDSEIDISKLQYPDGCFKIQSREESPGLNSFRFSYTRRIRLIKENFCSDEFLLKPYDIFISGIVYRIKQRLEKDGFNLKTAFQEFAPYCREYIASELKASNINLNEYELRRNVLGHLDELED